MAKIERTTSLTSTPKAQAVSRTTSTAQAEVISTPKGPVTAYAGQAAPPKKDLHPTGKQVTVSADPSSLWGEAPKPAPLDQTAFKKLPPTEQRAQIQALREERNQLSAEIQARLAKLDIKWNNSRLVTRTEALRDYQEQTKHLDPATKKELDGLLDRAEASQRKINELRARIDRLPKTPEAKKAQAELRTQLAKELRRARDEQSKVVKAATAVVDEQGLKTERLAVTEQVIDPSAPKPGSGDSLLDKVLRFLHLDGFLSWAAANTTMNDLFVAPVKQELQKRGEQLTEQTKLRVEHERRVKEDEEVSAQKTRELLGALTAPRTATAPPASGA